MLGTVIRDFRVKKGIRPKDVYSGIMDKSSYWRFEQGETRTSFETMLAILRKLNVSMEEFIHEATDLGSHKFELLQERSRAASNRRDFEELKKVAAGFLEMYKEKQSIRYFHYHCVTQLLIFRLQNKDLPKKYTQPLMKYLMKCEKWTDYEITLFTRVLYIFPKDSLELLFIEALKALEEYGELDLSKTQAVMLISNYFSLMIDFDDRQQVLKIKEILSQIQLPEISTYHRIRRNWLFEIIECYLTKEESYLEKAENWIEIFKMLEMKGVYDMHWNWTQRYGERIFDR